MFQVSLTKPVIVAALALTMLSGCTATTNDRAPPRATTVKVLNGCDCGSLHEWLQLQEDVSAMPVEDIAERLEGAERPESGEALYHFGLLNQQLDVFNRWADARDAFRQLAGDDSLAPELRRLSSILERYNQSRINWYEQYKQLEDENALLQQKIEAITELETTISTRKEQEEHEASVAPGR